MSNQVFVTVDEEDVDIGEQLNIDRNNLDLEFSEQAGLYAYWAIVAEEARANYEKASLALEVLEAELDGVIRDEARESGEKITEKVVESRINSDLGRQKRCEDKIEARKQANIMAVVKDAFGQRASMLQALGFMRRPELETDLRVLKEKAKMTIQRGRE